MENVRISESRKFELSGSQNIIQLICFLFEKQIVTVRDYLYGGNKSINFQLSADVS